FKPRPPFPHDLGLPTDVTARDGEQRHPDQQRPQGELEAATRKRCLFAHPAILPKRDRTRPKGAIANSQGREPLVRCRSNQLAPSGRQYVGALGDHLPPRWGWTFRHSKFQGLAPLAINLRPVGAILSPKIELANPCTAPRSLAE